MCKAVFGGLLTLLYFTLLSPLPGGRYTVLSHMARHMRLFYENNRYLNPYGTSLGNERDSFTLAVWRLSDLP